MLELELVKNFAIALVLGAFIGLEREYAQKKRKGPEYAGIRTFPLIALFGALSAYLGDKFSIYIFISGIILTGLLIVVAYFGINQRSKKYMGATTEMAGFLTFLIGALSYHGELAFAVVITVAITIILYSKSFLHKFTAKIKKQEFADTLKFAVIAFVILPFLPNQGYGPYQIFNPYIIWLMVVFISGISFVGYILMKWFGEKGIEIAAILGGLVSSTAVTSSFSDRSKNQPKIFRALALGVILANGIMFIRILIEVFVLNRDLFAKVFVPMLILAVVTAIVSYILWKKSKYIKGKINLGSPFTIKPALKFGLFFAIILALVKLSDVYLSSKGVYLVSFISGFADVDAITVSLSQLAKTSLTTDIARNGIMIAALTNVAVKGGIAYLFGGKQFGRLILGFYVVLIAIGLGTIFLL